jgi:hypothetical protein
VPHETQAVCIAALHEEIGRMREILANLRPTGVPDLDGREEDQRTPSVGLALNKTEFL